MGSQRSFPGVALVVVMLFASGARGQSIIVDQEDEEFRPSFLVLPYAFHTESLDLAMGVAGGTTGYMQEQESTFSAFLASTNSSCAVVLAGLDFNIPGLQRLFVDYQLSVGTYGQQRSYVDGNPDFPDEHGNE